jgi:hypothetical protein
MTSLPDRHETSPYRHKRSSSESFGVSPSKTRLSFSTVKIPKDKDIKTVTPYAKEWVPDADRTKCRSCEGVFGNLFRRKHHCRLCGDIFCHDCAPIRSELGIRSCNECLERRAKRLKNVLPEKYSKIYRSGKKAFARLCILRFEEINRMFRPNVSQLVLTRRIKQQRTSSPPPLPLTSPPVAIRATDSLVHLRLALEKNAADIPFENFEIRCEFFNLTDDTKLCDHFLRTSYDLLSDTDIVNFLRESFNCKRLLYRARRTSVNNGSDEKLRKLLFDAHQKYREAARKPLQVLCSCLLPPCEDGEEEEKSELVYSSTSSSNSGSSSSSGSEDDVDDDIEEEDGEIQ